MAKQKATKKSTKKAKKKGPKNQNKISNRPPKGMTQERYDRLVAEAQAPYKGLRKFIYGAVGASGAVGGFVFFTKILAGRDIAASLPNLALQIGIVALMIFLFRWEERNKEDS